MNKCTLNYDCQLCCGYNSSCVNSRLERVATVLGLSLVSGVTVLGVGVCFRRLVLSVFVLALDLAGVFSWCVLGVLGVVGVFTFRVRGGRGTGRAPSTLPACQSIPPLLARGAGSVLVTVERGTATFNCVAMA